MPLALDELAQNLKPGCLAASVAAWKTLLSLVQDGEGPPRLAPAQRDAWDDVV